MTNVLRVFFLLTLALAVLGRSPEHMPAGVVTPPGDFAAIRSQIGKLVEDGKVPSLAVAVARDGEIVWMEGFGWSDVEAGVRATPDTIYAIGSTSKSMTATLAMALAEKGLFDIGRAIDAYLDDELLGFLAIDGRYPTIRELLSMTGGVPHGGGVIGQSEYELSRDVMMRRVAVTAYPPGSVYEYSNYSIGLVMDAMEHATGRSYAQLMRDYVFEPLGMDSSSVSYRPLSPEQALLYDQELEALEYYRFFPEGAGGFYSSVSDLARFAMFHAGQWSPRETVISPANLDEMHYSRPLDAAGAISALGFGSPELDAVGGPWLISNGNVVGGNSHMSIFPAAGGVVVTAVNMTSRDSIADRLALEISELLVPGIGAGFQAFIASREAATRGPFAGGPEWTGQWHGVLEAEGYSRPAAIRITDDGDISLAIGDSPPADVAQPRSMFGSITGTVPGLVVANTGRGRLSGDPKLRLSLQGDTLFGHVVLRISDGNMRGNYPYRMRLTRQ